MNLVLVGINHKTADISLREKVAFPPEIVGEALSKIHKIPDLVEIVLLSTCNRTEFYISYELEKLTATCSSKKEISQIIKERQQYVVEWIADYHQLKHTQFSDSVYLFSDLDVVRHLMKVSCGLDSAVLGEPQIPVSYTHLTLPTILLV